MSIVFLSSPPIYRGIIKNAPSGQVYNVVPGQVIAADSRDVAFLSHFGFTPAPPSQQTVLTQTTQISHAQLLALGSSPISVIPAPGASKVIIPGAYIFRYDFLTRAYSGDGGSANGFFYGNITAGNVPGFLLNAPGSFVLAGPPPISVFSPAVGDYTNQPLNFGGTNLNAGPISVATVGAKGAGYAINDTGFVNTGSGDAAYVVDTVDGGGGILTFHFSDPGAAYVVGNGQITIVSTGSGNGAFTVNVASVLQGQGSASITMLYSIEDA